MLVGTGDALSTISFYEHCGFTISHRIENFFTDNYDHPIYEEGKLLTDMVYLKRTFDTHHKNRFELSVYLGEKKNVFAYITI